VAILAQEINLVVTKMSHCKGKMRSSEIQGDQKSLCTWWLQHRKLPVMFKVPPPVSRHLLIRQGDTRLPLTPSFIPNSDYVIMVSDWKFCFCTLIIRCTETFWTPCVTQRLVVIPYRIFGTTYSSHLQGTRMLNFLDSWPLTMGPIVCSETSVRDYH
jgi:hypothetical protein